MACDYMWTHSRHRIPPHCGGILRLECVGEGDKTKGAKFALHTLLQSGMRVVRVVDGGMFAMRAMWLCIVVCVLQMVLN